VTRLSLPPTLQKISRPRISKYMLAAHLLWEDTLEQSEADN